MLSSYKQLGKKIAGFKQSQSENRNILVDIQLAEIKKMRNAKVFKGMSNLVSGIADVAIARNEYRDIQDERRKREQEFSNKLRDEAMSTVPLNETGLKLDEMSLDDSVFQVDDAVIETTNEELFQQSLQTIFEVGSPISQVMNITKSDSPFGEPENTGTLFPGMKDKSGKIVRGQVQKYQKQPSGKIVNFFKGLFD